jgi:multidrug efflux pump subunit AcrA (membrane-fusion protein)
MSFGQPTPVDDLPRDAAWQEIESVLEELSQLACTAVTPAELHGRLLERLAGLLSAAGSMVWAIGTGGHAELECQLRLGEALAGDSDELARHQRLAEIAAAGREARLIPPAYRDAELANASPWLAILCPIVVEQRTIAVVEILQRPDGRASIEEGYLRLVRTACEIVEEFHRSQAHRGSRQRQEELAGLVDYVQRIHRRLDLPAVAAAIANEARRLLGCDRVSVLACRGRRPRMEAVSGVESFDRRSGVVQGMEQLARLVVSADETLWLPAEGDELPAELGGQVQSLLEESHAKGMGLLPLRAELDEASQPVGLLVVERFAAEFDPAQRERAAALARASGGAVANAIAYERIPLRRTMQWLAASLGLAPGQRWSPSAGVAIGLVSVVLALWLIPADFAVEARGQLMPVRRQHVFAPSDGVIVELPPHDGDQVQKGQMLARLHSPTLDIDESELVGKQRTVQENLVAAETTALRSEVEGNSTQPRGQLTAKVEQLKEELRGLKEQLQIVRKEQADLTVQSPLDGIVITWDAQRQLAGRPVKRGDALLTVANTGGPWELILDVPDQSAGHIAAARRENERLPVSFQLGTDPGTVGRGTVAFVAPATELSAESQPAVRVTVALDGPSDPKRRPGATVVARIHCGRRSLGYVWLHEIWEAVRLRLFL